MRFTRVDSRNLLRRGLALAMKPSKTADLALSHETQARHSNGIARMHREQGRSARTSSPLTHAEFARDDHPTVLPAIRTRNFARATSRKGSACPPRIGFAGDAALLESIWIPAFARTSAVLRYVVGSVPRTAIRLGRRFRLSEATTEISRLLDDPDLTAIVFAGGDESNTSRVLEAVRAGKQVFLDGAQCCWSSQWAEPMKAALASGMLTIAWPGRFAPLVQTIVDTLQDIPGPREIELLIRPTDSRSSNWPRFLDLLRAFVPHAVARVKHGTSLPEVAPKVASSARMGDDRCELDFADGSRGVIRFDLSAKAPFRHERMNIVCTDASFQLDDFQKLRVGVASGVRSRRLWRPDFGHRQLVQEFVESLGNGRPLFDPKETAASLNIARELVSESRKPLTVALRRSPAGD